MKKLKFFTNVFFVRGYNRSILIDLQNNKIQFVHNTTHEFLKNNNYELDKNSSNLLFLKKNYLSNFIFEIDKNELIFFPKMQLNWYSYSKITNVLVYIEDSVDDYLMIFLKLLNQDFNCYSITLIVKLIINTNQIYNLIEVFSKLYFYNINLIFEEVSCHFNFYDFEKLNHFNNVYIYKSNLKKKTQKLVFLDSHFKINYKIFKDDFIINKLFFCESQLYNTYYNRKIFIDSNGFISNTPIFENNYGIISDINDYNSISKIISNKYFKKLWKISKNMIDICKECEFMHLCQDNCPPKKRKNGDWYRPVECNYNPYISKWDDEEGYLTLEECGVICNENEFRIDHEKIANINKTLWEDE